MKGPHVTQASGPPPLTVVPDQPRPVEDLVAESNGAPSSSPIVSITPPLTTAAPNPEPEVIPAEPPRTYHTGVEINDPSGVDPLPIGDFAPGTELAIPSNVELEVWTNDEPWDHETVDFRGDTLNVRKPTDQALAGLSLSSSKYVKMTTRNDITGLFIARHLSPESYDRVFSRLMDPDDAEYTVETIGELMGAIVGNRGDAQQ